MNYPALTANYIENSRSKNTRLAYLSDWKAFQSYCKDNNLTSLPCTQDTLIRYIINLAETKKVTTILRHLSSISQAHSSAYMDSPTKSFNVHTVLDGIKRTKGCKVDKKLPIIADDMNIIVSYLGDSLIDIRDRAIMLLGLSGAFRRGELTMLTMNDILFTKEGIVVTLKHSKTDQYGQGRHVGIPYGKTMCPVQAVKAWIEASKITDGFLFRSINRYGRIGNSLGDREIARIVKKLAEKAGYNPENYAGHSLRSGFITTAAKQGVSERLIMKQSGHKNITVMRSYIHDATLFEQSIL